MFRATAQPALSALTKLRQGFDLCNVVWLGHVWLLMLMQDTYKMTE